MYVLTCIGFHPGRVELASSRVSCLLKKILWDLIGGRVPSHTRKNALFCRRFLTGTSTERSEAAGCRNRNLLDFHQSPFCWVAVLILLGARPIHLCWPYQELKFPTSYTRCHRTATLRRGWTLGRIYIYVCTLTHTYAHIKNHP